MAEEQSNSLVSKLIGYFPAITALAVLILSIFNIGYFSKIGLHFLGVMDLSNLVYPLSFIIAIVTGSLGVYFWGDYLERIAKNAGDFKGRKKVILIFLLFIVCSLTATAIVAVYFPQIAPKHFLLDRVAATVSGILAIIVLIFEYADYKGTKPMTVSGGYGSVLIAIFALYYLGRAVAEHEIYTVKSTYEFRIKDETVPIVAKILRASSAGFIIFADNRVMFLPQSEIKQVRATAELSN